MSFLLDLLSILFSFNSNGGGDAARMFESRASKRRRAEQIRKGYLSDIGDQDGR